jgi:hypothetical protein
MGNEMLEATQLIVGPQTLNVRTSVRTCTDGGVSVCTGRLYMYSTMDVRTCTRHTTSSFSKVFYQK